MAEFFVSYTSSDREWAFWIGQELEALGHTPRIHEWEIPAGGDIPGWMETCHHNADYVLCIVSKAYLGAPYSAWERRAAQWVSVTKRPNFVIPVLIEECDILTLFGHIRRLDLYGVADEDDARERLAKFLETPAKPQGLILFPGPKKSDKIVSRLLARQYVAFPGRIYNSNVAISNIPISVPMHFFGRAESLDKIESVLKRNEERVAITTLHGMRGVGKSTLAAAYASRQRNNYLATWWIRAQTIPTMRADLVALGVKLGCVAPEEKEEPALAAVMERLKDAGEGVLLVFDNANSAKEIEPYLPLQSRVRVLITSNDPAWGKIASKIEIDVWPIEVGADYLIARTGRSNERDAALSLSAALGGLPLAHEQAAAYCERLGLSFVEYYKRFESAPAKILDDTTDAPAEYHGGLTVAKTFGLAIDEVAKLHPAAEPMIVYSALLAPEPIPLFLFAEARQVFGEPLTSALAGDGLDETVAVLRAFALVDRETIADERDPSITMPCIRLHRLVRQVAALRRQDVVRERSLVALMTALETVYPSSVFEHPETWPRARRLDAIALALLNGDEGLPNETKLQAARILQELGAYRQYALAAYAQARPLFERALKLREQALGTEHHLVGVSISYLAHLLAIQKNFAEARKLFERALAISEKLHGPEHPNMPVALNNLGSTLVELEDFDGARILHERALAICERVLGVNDQTTAQTLNHLGYVLMRQERFAEARANFERALTILENVLGDTHPGTNVARGNLAGALFRIGDLSKAHAIAEVALARHDTILGPDHPWTRYSAHITACSLFALGRTKEAGALVAKYDLTQPEPGSNFPYGSLS